MRCSLKFYLLLLLFIAVPAFGIEEVVSPVKVSEDEAQSDIIDKIKGYVEDSEYLLGDFKGYRTKLKEKGIDIQSSYMINAFVMKNKSTSVRKGTYQGLYNLSVDLDSEKAGLYKGGKLHFLYQVGNKGMSSPDFLNSYSFVNSYDPVRAINQISELYYEQSIKDDLLNVKFGKQDANADFQALDTGFEFLNLSFSYLDNTPMPLFPSQQTGVRARLKISENVYIQDGFYDGNLEIGAGPKSFFTGKNNYLNMSEIYKLTDINGKQGKYMAGGWIKTGKYDSPYGVKHNNYGFYAGFEQKLIDRFEDKSGGLNAFAQFGYARNSVNDVPYYYGTGLVYKGISKKRKNDSVGIAFAWHQFNKNLHNIESRTSEKVVEFFYKIKLTEFLYIQPDVQYIIKPGGNGKNSFAFGLRSCITF